MPDVPEAQLRGIRACAPGHHFYEPLVERVDPRGGRYFWLGGPHSDFGPERPSEGHFVEQGWATLVPLTTRITDEQVLGKLADWDAVDSFEPQ